MSQITPTDAATILRAKLEESIRDKVTAAENLAVDHPPFRAGERWNEACEKLTEMLDIVFAERAAIQPAGNLLNAAERVQTAAYNFNASKFVLGSKEHHAAAHEYQAAQDALIRSAIAANYATPIPQEAKAEQGDDDWEKDATAAGLIVNGLAVSGARLNAFFNGHRAGYARAQSAVATPSSVTTPAAPEGDSEAGELPPLPEPVGCMDLGSLRYEGYIAGQMREYGQLCRDTAPSSVTSAPSDAVAWAFPDGLGRLARVRDGYADSPSLVVNATQTDGYTVPLFSHPPTAPATGCIGDDAKFVALLDNYAQNGTDGYLLCLARIAAYVNRWADARSPIAAAREVADPLHRELIRAINAYGNARESGHRDRASASYDAIMRALFGPDAVVAPAASTPPAHDQAEPPGLCAPFINMGKEWTPEEATELNALLAKYPPGNPKLMLSTDLNAKIDRQIADCSKARFREDDRRTTDQPHGEEKRTGGDRRAHKPTKS